MRHQCPGYSFHIGGSARRPDRGWTRWVVRVRRARLRVVARRSGAGNAGRPPSALACRREAEGSDLEGETEDDLGRVPIGAAEAPVAQAVESVEGHEPGREGLALAGEGAGPETLQQGPVQGSRFEEEGLAQATVPATDGG